MDLDQSILIIFDDKMKDEIESVLATKGSNKVKYFMDSYCTVLV